MKTCNTLSLYLWNEVFRWLETLFFIAKMFPDDCYHVTDDESYNRGPRYTLLYSSYVVFPQGALTLILRTSQKQTTNYFLKPQVLCLYSLFAKPTCNRLPWRDKRSGKMESNHIPSMAKRGHGQWENMMTSSNGSSFRATGHLCGEFTGPRWIPALRPVTRNFDVFFDLCLNKRLSKQS